MKKFLICTTLFLLLVAPAFVAAAPADLIIEFDKPALREDGAILNDAEIKEYVFYDQCNSTKVELIRLNNSGNLDTASTTVDWADNSNHSICFEAIDTFDSVGLTSASYDFTFDLIGRPGAGQIRSITVTCTAQRCRVFIN